MTWCQSGFHDFSVIITQFNNIQGILICQRCILILQNYQGNDVTMDILYRWSDECGTPPSLPNSLAKGSESTAELAYYFDTELNGTLRKRNPAFPNFLSYPNEKQDFLIWIKHNQKIINILYDVKDENDRKNIMLRLWVGLKDAAKTIRKDYNTSQRDAQGNPITKDYTTTDRTNTFTFVVDAKADKDVIYANGVEAAPYHELVKMHHSQVYLQGVPITSRVWKYIKYKGKCIVSLSDIEDICN